MVAAATSNDFAKINLLAGDGDGRIIFLHALLPFRQRQGRRKIAGGRRQAEQLGRLAGKADERVLRGHRIMLRLRQIGAGAGQSGARRQNVNVGAASNIGDELGAIGLFVQGFDASSSQFQNIGAQLHINPRQQHIAAQVVQRFLQVQTRQFHFFLGGFPLRKNRRVKQVLRGGQIQLPRAAAGDILRPAGADLRQQR